MMTKNRAFLRDAKVFELIGGVFGWTWMLGTLVGIGWIIAAAVGNASWLAGIGIFLGAQFAKAVAREYNRSAQKAITDGVAAGRIRIDENNQARPLDHTVQLTSAASIDGAFSWANDLVSQYASLLQRPRDYPFFAESALPASKDELKRAILIVAAARRAKGEISNSEVDAYRTAYMLLMNAASDERVLDLGQAMASVKKAGGTSQLSNVELRDVARNVASAFRGIDPDHEAREGLSLIAEFDKGLAELLAIYDPRHHPGRIHPPPG